MIFLIFAQFFYFYRLTKHTAIMPRLIIVPTPVGNMNDITLRALNVLKTVSVILAEDTRTSSHLLRHHGISTRLIPYHQFNEHKSLESLSEKILSGGDAALISDAGTPGISDAGFLLIRHCIQEGIEVECLPGPTAFVPALVASGLPCDRFYFEGFLPHKKGRQTRIRFLEQLPCTFIIYESPHRIMKTLEQLSEALGNERRAVIAREISKIHEEYLRGSLSDLLLSLKNQTIKGEIVLLVEGCEK